MWVVHFEAVGIVMFKARSLALLETMVVVMFKPRRGFRSRPWSRITGDCKRRW